MGAALIITNIIIKQTSTTANWRKCKNYVETGLN